MCRVAKQAFLFVISIVFCSSQSFVIAQETAPAPPNETTDETFNLSEVHSGEYILEHDHGRVHWTVSHHGFSMFTAVFPLVDAKLNLNSEDITKSQLEVSVDMQAVDSSIDIFDQRLNSSAWLDTDKYPLSTYSSTEVLVTGPNSFTVIGNLTFMGEIQPLSMDVKFIKAANPPRPPGGYRIGFNASALMVRSQWGMPKSTVGDEVSLSIEAEFLRPEALEQH